MIQESVCNISSRHVTEMPYDSDTPRGATLQTSGVFGTLVNTRYRRFGPVARAVPAGGHPRRGHNTTILSWCPKRGKYSPRFRRRSSTAASSLPWTLVISHVVPHLRLATSDKLFEGVAQRGRAAQLNENGVCEKIGAAKAAERCSHC